MTYARYSGFSGGGGGGITTYATFTDLPSTTSDGAAAITLDTDTLYIFNLGSLTWLPVAKPGDALAIGTFDSGTASSNGAHIDVNALIMQSASTSKPGLVNNTTQSFSGNKTFTGTISASNLSGTNTGDVTIGTANGLSLLSQALSLAAASTSTTGALTSTDWNTFNGKQSSLTIGNFTDAGTDGIVVTGGTGSVIGAGTSIAQHVADTTHNGYLSSTDWNTFNGKASSVLTSAHIYVGNVSNVATDTAVTGDVTITNAGVTAIGANKVTLGMQATLLANTAIANATGSTATPTAVPMTSTSTASAIALRDANKNISSNNYISDYTTTATAAGTTVLTVGSTYQQFFTGSTTQTVTLPVASTLTLGHTFFIVNNSSGIVTVNSSGANLVQSMAGGSELEVTCILTSGTTAASWQVFYVAATSGITPVSAGGTGATTAGSAFNTLWNGLATTLGDSIAQGAANPQRISGNTSLTPKVWTQTGNGTTSALPTWVDPNTLITNNLLLSPNFQAVTATGAGTFGLSYWFVVTSANATVGAVYTNNAQTFTVARTISGATLLLCTSTGAPTSSGTLTKSSGTGDATITFSTFRAPIYLKIRAVAGGAGAGGGGIAGTGGTGGAGGNTTFSSLISCLGAAGGAAAGSNSGGSASITSPAIGLAMTGSGGGGWFATNAAGSAFGTGGIGGSSIFGQPGLGIANGAGLAAGVNSGSGGGGGGFTAGAVGSSYAAPGGGAGGYAEAIVYSPSATYSISVGTGGGGGTAGTSGFAGGGGGSGFIEVTEHFQ